MLQQLGWRFFVDDGQPEVSSRRILTSGLPAILIPRASRISERERRLASR
jgi:hypothetical protein